jgi:hypothetical protein
VKHRILIGVLLVLCGAGALCWSARFRSRAAVKARRMQQGPAHLDLLHSSRPSTSPEIAFPADAAARMTDADRANVAKIAQAFSAPIDFYGKVVDEKGRPVANATVHYSVASQYFGDSAKHDGVSDGEGRFSIIGARGAGLYVTVAKEGYYETEYSGSGFGYGVPTGKRPPSREAPALFMLRHKGDAARLIHWGTSATMVCDGTPVALDLATGQRRSSGDLRVRCWAQAGDIGNPNDQYRWECNIELSRGGLVRRDKDYDFEAPSDGYRPEDQIDSSSDRWSPRTDRNYFVRTADDHFGRITVRIRTGRECYVTVESYLNPEHGSHNLEYDPRKEITVRQ